MSGSLARLFAPKSIAIVGASAARRMPSYTAMHALEPTLIGLAAGVALHEPGSAEIDINPLLATRRGRVALDAARAFE